MNVVVLSLLVVFDVHMMCVDALLIQCVFE